MNESTKTYVEFIGKIVAETEFAILFQEETKTREEAVWLPISQLNILNKDFKTDEVEIEVQEWIALEKELV